MEIKLTITGIELTHNGSPAEFGELLGELGRRLDEWRGRADATPPKQDVPAVLTERATTAEVVKRPRQKRNMSPEARARAAERMRQWQANRRKEAGANATSFRGDGVVGVVQQPDAGEPQSGSGGVSAVGPVAGESSGV